MIGRTDLGNISDKLAFDGKGLDELKQAARSNSPEALKAAAIQFEALFMSMMLKSMRQAGGQEGMFENEQSRMYTTMLDQQLSQKMASRGIGLADAMLRQLSNNASHTMGQALAPDEATTMPDFNGMQGLVGINQYQLQQRQESRSPPAPQGAVQVQEFGRKLGPHAELASQITGIPAKFMLGQAALESGWGKREIKALDGSTSHNVFGIKASASWKGNTVDALTTEYSNGVAHQRVEKFRAYDNYADAFQDYAKLLTDNPRYRNVIEHGTDAAKFATELQKAGYATDPRYAEKLTQIIRHSL